MTKRIGEQAVVVGAGIAGLSAARVLAEFYEKVVVLEQDERPSGKQARSGVPQGRQPHILMCGGLNALADLFPGLSRDLEIAGANLLNAGSDFRFEIPGIGVRPKRRFAASSYSMTRPLLERILARRAEGWPNIEFRRRCRALEFLAVVDGPRVVGVQYQHEDGDVRVAGADLVIDASARGDLTRACLESVGAGVVPQTSISVDIGYANAVFAIPVASTPDFIALSTHPDAPESSRGGYMLKIEDGLWQVLLVGRDDDRPPGDVDGFLAFARTLPTTTIADAIRDAGRPDEIVRFRFRESVWRHFGEMPRMPAGLLPIGDAICRFNPVYGQGMSVAAQEAVLLRDILAAHARSPSPEGLARKFLIRAEDVIAPPWNMSAVPDFLYPGTSGDRPDDLEQQLRRLREMFEDAVHDPQAHRALTEAQHLLPPGSTAIRSLELI